MATMLGSLLVSLGLESASFRKGLTEAERSMKRTQQRFDRIGTKFANIGKAFSVGITAPALGAAAVIGRATNQMAADARELAVAAQVAGEGFEQFQRQAFAAKSVGIEFEKLGDIFKDVRDRVGDFAATGGGPMADFFENIAPKVGLTAEAFKGLSGKDALQLYFDSLRAANVSQEEMVFYLEAMASDATALIPLLENSGAAMKELEKNATVITEDDRARLEQYTKAQERLGEAVKAVTIAFVSSGLLDVIVSLVERFAEFAESLSQTNPQLLEIGVVVVGLAAALGPLLLAVGNLVSGFGILLPLLVKLPAIFAGIKVAGVVMFGALKASALLLMANPVLLGFGAVIAGIYLVWKNWDKIGPMVKRLYEQVKTWLLDKLGAIFRGVQDKIAAVKDTFEDLYIAVVGNSYVPDMVDGIAAEMSRLDAVMVAPARDAAQAVKEEMRTVASETKALLDRLFPELAAQRQRARELFLIDNSELSDQDKIKARYRLETGLRTDDLSFAPGVARQVSEVQEIMDRQADALENNADRTKVQTVRIAKSFKEMADDTISALDRMVSAIQGGGFLDILSGVLNLGLQLGSIGAFGNGIAQNINSASIPGFANGTNFAPGGLALVGERGPELVNLPRGSQVIPNNELRAAAGSGRIDVFVHPSGEFDARVKGVAANVVNAAAPAIASAGSRAARADIARMNERRLR